MESFRTCMLESNCPGVIRTFTYVRLLMDLIYVMTVIVHLTTQMQYTGAKGKCR